MALKPGIVASRQAIMRGIAASTRSGISVAAPYRHKRGSISGGGAKTAAAHRNGAARRQRQRGIKHRSKQSA